jgi:hypothetical protein
MSFDKLYHDAFSFMDISDNKNYAFRMASENGHLGVVRALLSDPRALARAA